MKFTREPAAYGAAIAAVLSALAVFGLPFLTDQHVTLWVAVVDGAVAVLVAWRVRPIAPSLVTYLITAGAALTAGYGLAIPDRYVAGANALVVALLFALTRVQQTPVVDPVPTAVKPEHGTVR